MLLVEAMSWPEAFAIAAMPFGFGFMFWTLSKADRK